MLMGTCRWARFVCRGDLHSLGYCTLVPQGVDRGWIEVEFAVGAIGTSVRLQKLLASQLCLPPYSHETQYQGVIEPRPIPHPPPISFSTHSPTLSAPRSAYGRTCSKLHIHQFSISNDGNAAL